MATMLKSDSLISIIDDQYELLEAIGSGGWSTVYKARQIKLERLVAVKVLHEHLAEDHEKIKRFQQESKLVGGLSHPAIAQVFDYGVLPSGQPYIVMEYLEGRSLADVIRAGEKLSLVEALPVFIAAAEGLEAAHEKGLVHRDISPANIFLSGNQEHQQVKVLDFGLAKVFKHEEQTPTTGLTETGEILGTRFYMSPEQCMGKVLDGRSDIYSLGCVMYETFTGKKPFEGATAFDCMYKHMNEMPPPFSSIEQSKSLPKVVEAVVLKTMAKETKDRYQSMSQLRDDIADLHFHERTPNFVAEYIKIWRSRSKASRRIMGSTRHKVMTDATIALLVLGCGVLIWQMLQGKINTDILRKNFQDATEKAADALAPAVAWTKHFDEGQVLLNNKLWSKAAACFELAAQDGERLGAMRDGRLLQALEKLKAAYERGGEEEKAKSVETRIAAIKMASRGGTEKETLQEIMTRAVSLLISSDKKEEQKRAEQLAQQLNNEVWHMVENDQKEAAQQMVLQNLKFEEKALGINSIEYARGLENAAFHGSAPLRAELMKKLAIKDLSKPNSQPAITESILMKAHELLKKQTPNGEEYTENLRHIAELYRSQRRFEETRPFIDEAIAIDKRMQRTDKLTEDIYYLLPVLAFDHKRDEAIKEGIKAIQLRKEIGLFNTAMTGYLADQVAEDYMKQKEFDKAEPFMKDKQSIYEQVWGAESEAAMRSCYRTGLMYGDGEEWVKAEPYLKKAYNYYHHLAPNDGACQQLYNYLLKSYQLQRKTEQADQLRRSFSKVST